MAGLKFPTVEKEAALHDRVVGEDPVVPVDVFQSFMDPMCAALRHDLHCREEEAYDSAVDAVMSYLQNPRRYIKELGRLSTYLMEIAKRRAIDRLRSRTASDRREKEYGALLELRATNPKEEMNARVEARELWAKVEEVVPDRRDRRALQLMLAGEKSTDVLAKELGLINLPQSRRRQEVKRHRDRLLNVLKRLGDKYDKKN
jgi:RNA polymerase sigma-70 factor, ECF subfamily